MLCSSARRAERHARWRGCGCVGVHGRTGRRADAGAQLVRQSAGGHEVDVHGVCGGACAGAGVWHHQLQPRVHEPTHVHPLVSRCSPSSPAPPCRRSRSTPLCVTPSQWSSPSGSWWRSELRTCRTPKHPLFPSTTPFQGGRRAELGLTDWRGPGHPSTAQCTEG